MFSPRCVGLRSTGRIYVQTSEAVKARRRVPERPVRVWQVHCLIFKSFCHRVVLIGGESLNFDLRKELLYGYYC